MAMFAIATIPLIHQLKESSLASQVWFADNATPGGELRSLNNGGMSLSELVLTSVILPMPQSLG